MKDRTPVLSLRVVSFNYLNYINMQIVIDL